MPHSDGPWIAGDLGFIFDGAGTALGQAIDTRGYPFEDNSRVMAAAPEMLEALEDIVTLLVKLQYVGWTRQKRLLDVIAKAKGKECDGSFIH